jgi:hypothetical protein
VRPTKHLRCRVSPPAIRFLEQVLRVRHDHMSVSPGLHRRGPLVLDHVGIDTRQCTQVRESCQSRAPGQLWEY